MSGTTVDAGTTGAASRVGQGAVCCQWYGEKQFSEETHASRTFDIQLVVVAYPADSGLHGPVTLQYRSRVAECPVGCNAQSRCQCMQFVRHHVMVVVP